MVGSGRHDEPDIDSVRVARFSDRASISSGTKYGVTIQIRSRAAKIDETSDLKRIARHVWTAGHYLDHTATQGLTRLGNSCVVSPCRRPHGRVP